MATDNLYQEKDLLARIASGEEPSFRKLFDQYHERVYNFAMHLTRSEILSEEIVQEVFMKVWKSREKLSGIDYFPSYIRTIARNTALDYFRKIAKEKLALRGLSGQRAEQVNREDAILDREYSRILNDIVQSLPPRQQQVYKLSRQEGLKNDEIARQLGISVYTVKEYLQLALHTVLKQLEARIELVIAITIAIYF